MMKLILDGKTLVAAFASCGRVAPEIPSVPRKFFWESIASGSSHCKPSFEGCKIDNLERIHH